MRFELSYSISKQMLVPLTASGETNILRINTMYDI